MKKDIIKIIVIIIFFYAVGYAITYPYEVSYEGSSDIVLIEDGKNYETLGDVIQHPKLQNSLLYIMIWEPLEDLPIWFEKKDYDKKIEQLKLKIAHSNTTTHRDSSNLEQLIKGKITFTKGFVDFEDYLIGLNKLQNNYTNKDVKIVFIDHPDTESNRIEDDIRKWKSVIKKHQIKGYHFLASKQLLDNLIQQLKVEDKKLYFPYRLLTNSSGEVIDYSAPAVFLEQKILYKKIDSLLLIN